MRELDKARAYAESLIKNAPDPVFVSDLEGKILQANDAVSALLGFRPDELLEQSLSRFISPEETREFTAALREVVERGVTRNARLNPRSASGEGIPTSLDAARPGRQGDRRHRHLARHAGVRAGGPRPGEIQERAAGEDLGSGEVRGGRRRPRAEDDRPRKGSGELAQGSREAQAGENLMAMPETVADDRQQAVTEPDAAATSERRLRAQVEMLERRLRKGDEQRRAMLHIMSDLNEFNKRLTNQRKAMLHPRPNYGEDRRRLASQTERLDNSRRALLHLLQDSHKDKLRLEASRKATIHIMGDLRDTTVEVQRREQELRDKQEQLVQAGAPATPAEA